MISVAYYYTLMTRCKLIYSVSKVWLVVIGLAIVVFATGMFAAVNARDNHTLLKRSFPTRC